MMVGVLAEYKASLTIIITCLGIIFVLIPCDMIWIYALLAWVGFAFIAILGIVVVYDIVNVVRFMEVIDQSIMDDGDNLVYNRMANVYIYGMKIIFLMILTLGFTAMLGLSVFHLKCDDEGHAFISWMKKWIHD